VQIAIAKRPLEPPHCGDEAGIWTDGSRQILCIVDGLGHGQGAERAAKAAMEYLARHYWEPLKEIFAGCDRAMRNTRGVAIGIATFNPDVETLTYAGIGNTRALLVDQPDIALKSDYGIVGGGYRILTPKTVPFSPGQVLVLFTDGIKENIDVGGYESEVKTNAAVLAQKIICDWATCTDDAAVLVFING